MENPMKQYIITTTVLALVCGLPATAKDKPWEFEVEIGAEREAVYVGSDTYKAEADFGLKATYTAPNDIEWSISTGGLGVGIPLANDFGLQFALEYEPGRDNADDPILTGFPKMENTWEFQAVLTKDIGDFQVGVGVQKDILNHGKGLVGFVGVGYARQLTDRLSFSSLLDVSFADSTHMNTEVGISGATATATGLAAYSPKSGYKGTSLTVGFDYALTQRATLYTDFSAETYGSAIADSPLVKTHGSKTTTSVGAGIRFRF
jgi:outer membrane scaffolding protein for murein synthesis (MipA/OmpV family)